MINVSIVIPNWNGEKKIRDNLPKVLELTVKEVIVVDDASSDSSLEVLKNNFPTVKVIAKKKNGGFSSAVNTGVNEASGTLVFLLNTDAVPDKNCLKYILPHFEDKRVFSVGCNSGGSWSWAKFEKGYFWHFVTQKVTNTHQTLWVSGGSGVFRRTIWEKLGGLDELYAPFYEEDLDIGYRATKRGYINLWEPKALVKHNDKEGVIKENFPKGFIEKISQRNQLIFIWKNITSPSLTKRHIKALAAKLITSPKYWTIFLSALIHLPAIYSERILEKQEKKISDEGILSKFELV